MGCDYRCSRSKLLELKLLKKDPLENADEFTKMLLKLGNEFEPAALSAFQLAFRKRKLSFNGYVPGMTPHPNFKWFTGTPDYIMDLNGYKCVVEIKTHWNESPETATPISCVQCIPLRHWLQVQAYLEILDLQIGYLWSWTINHGSSCFRINREKMFWDSIVFPEVLFFRSVYEGKHRYKNGLTFKLGEAISSRQDKKCHHYLHIVVYDKW